MSVVSTKSKKLEKCELCNNKGEMRVGTYPWGSYKQIYCIKHYVNKENEECLYHSDLDVIFDKKKEGKLNNFDKKLLKEIEKQHPDLVDMYKKEHRL